MRYSEKGIKIRLDFKFRVKIIKVCVRSPFCFGGSENDRNPTATVYRVYK
ncbi:hypothetical protein GCM10008986_29460 [Salinibacillus aidingensis]|uniref:Uncharacterized protein n=1 Tax=Salinibacillus aidingensis TaxID=237684 RepID=A0ABN1BM21_9BACI